MEGLGYICSGVKGFGPAGLGDIRDALMGLVGGWTSSYAQRPVADAQRQALT